MSRAFALSFAGAPPDGLRARRLTLRDPGGDVVLGELAGRFAAERSEEPWVAGDPVDGGFHLLVAGDLSDLEPGDDDSDGASVPEAVLGVAFEAARLPLRAAGAVRHPGEALGTALATGERALGAAASLVWPRPATPYEEADAAALHVVWVRLDAERLAPLTDGPGGGVDGVLASAVSRALRDDLDRLGHDGEAGDANRVAAEVLGAAETVPDDPRVAGRRPREIRPLPLPPEGMALGMAALRDPGGVTVGIAADPRVLDPDALAGELEAAVQELLDAAQAEPTAPAASESPAPGEGGPPPSEPGGAGAAAAPPAQDDPPAPLPGQVEPPVETPTELVAEVAEPGAQDGAGAEVRIAEPWEGYAAMPARDVIARLDSAGEEELAVVTMYERAHKGRQSVIAAAERALSRR